MESCVCSSEDLIQTAVPSRSSWWTEPVVADRDALHGFSRGPMHRQRLRTPVRECRQLIHGSWRLVYRFPWLMRRQEYPPRTYGKLTRMDSGGPRSTNGQGRGRDECLDQETVVRELIESVGWDPARRVTSIWQEGYETWQAIRDANLWQMCAEAIEIQHERLNALSTTEELAARYDGRERADTAAEPDNPLSTPWIIRDAAYWIRYVELRCAAKFDGRH